jgi:hypothetical protein
MEMADKDKIEGDAEPSPNSRIRSLIEIWEVPKHSPGLDGRVMAAYDTHTKKTAPAQFWKRILTLTFPMPVTVATAIVLLFFIWGLPLMRDSNISLVEKLPPVPKAPQIIQVPVPQEKIETRPIYSGKKERKSPVRGGGDRVIIDSLIKPGDLPPAGKTQPPITGGPAIPEEGTARQFTLNDVRLSINSFRLLINGRQVASGEKTGDGRAGPLIWFYLPQRGRFIFSIIPHEGYPFQNIGVVEGNKISFSMEGDLFEWISSSPIIGDGGNWRLWVMRDASYRPDFEVGLPEESLLIGAADSMEFLLPK